MTPPDRVREAREHELKVWPQDFAALADGRKTFEWRQDDRGFAEGDTLWLREWSPGNAHRGEEAGYSGRELRRTISYILRARFGMPEHYVVMALAPVESAAEIAALKADIAALPSIRIVNHGGIEFLARNQVLERIDAAMTARADATR